MRCLPIWYHISELGSTQIPAAFAMTTVTSRDQNIFPQVSLRNLTILWQFVTGQRWPSNCPFLTCKTVTNNSLLMWRTFWPYSTPKCRRQTEAGWWFIVFLFSFFVFFFGGWGSNLLSIVGFIFGWDSTAFFLKCIFLSTFLARLFPPRCG